jgi:hypothetical protein
MERRPQFGGAAACHQQQQLVCAELGPTHALPRRPLCFCAIPRQETRKTRCRSPPALSLVQVRRALRRRRGPRGRGRGRRRASARRRCCFRITPPTCPSRRLTDRSLGLGAVVVLGRGEHVWAHHSRRAVSHPLPIRCCSNGAPRTCVSVPVWYTSTMSRIR